MPFMLATIRTGAGMIPSLLNAAATSARRSRMMVSDSGSPLMGTG